jgi:phosphoglycerol transferase MdoB-like AlkP superfamily enzyme
MRSILRPPSTRLAIIAFGLFLTISFLSRLLLAFKSVNDVSWDASLLGSFVCGMSFDFAAGIFAASLWLVLGLVLPTRFLNSRTGRHVIIGLMTVFVSLLVFITCSEWFFWDEFGARFNFIAVDYLIFTQEVLGNIFESYPMGLILTAIGLVAAGIVWSLHRMKVLAWAHEHPCGIRGRIIPAILGLVIPTAVFLTVSQSSLANFTNQYHLELAKNGCWSFFAAGRNMELNFDEWYLRMPQEKMLLQAKQRLVTPNEVASSARMDDLQRSTLKSGPEKKWNVILICMESMSADFMTYAGNHRGITPNLDRIAGESVFFENLYATGTRTVRGMEAITLNLPPTPGQAIIYRPEGKDLVTTFSPFLKRGYDCGFFYGGDGKFDYMNRFFSSSGCRIMDVKAWQQEDVTFKTSWGACDEDLFNKTLSEADKAYASGTPFHYFCMTTSNHRPYDFPSGKIDLPSHTGGRRAAVKYSDWAVGKLLEDASKRPWFNNTLFVFSADHCASSAGKSDLDVTKFHIPAMIYNPTLLKARKITRLSSQIDIMPTVFGLLNWSTDTLGFGNDLLAEGNQSLEGRTFISNYQKIALLKDDSLVILKPKRQSAVYSCDPHNGKLTLLAEENPRILEEAVTYYQSASWLFKSGKLRKSAANLTPVANR